MRGQYWPQMYALALPPSRLGWATARSPSVYAHVNTEHGIAVGVAWAVLSWHGPCHIRNRVGGGIRDIALPKRC